MSFPFSIGAGEYSIVQMECIPPYGDWRYGDYVFVFQTISNPKKELKSKDHCIVNIEIIDGKRIPFLNWSVHQAKKLKYTGGNLRINDYVEIVEDKNEYQHRFIAVLKKQFTEDHKGNLLSISDQHILLCSDNRSSSRRLGNLPVAEFGPEFQAYIHYETFDKEYKDIQIAINQLSYLKSHSVEEIKALLEAKREQIGKERDRYLNEYIWISRREG